MKKQMLIVALMLILTIGLVTAVPTTSVDFEDCVEIGQGDCIDWEVTHDSCDHWNSGSGENHYHGQTICGNSGNNGCHCSWWNWNGEQCVEWEQVCVEWVDNSINIPSTGGTPGPQGEQGDVGPQGDKGDTGDTGEQGIQGIQGETGEQGETGPMGAPNPHANYADVSGFSLVSGASMVSGYSSQSGNANHADEADYADEAGHADEADYADRAGYASRSGTAGFSYTSGIAGYSAISGYALYAGSSGDGSDAVDLIEDNQEQWSRDTSGVSRGALIGILTGSYDFEDDYDSYNDYVLAQMDELYQQLQGEHDYLECMIKFGHDAAQFDLVHCAARKLSARIGEKVELEDGYVCSSTTCVRFYTYPVYVEPTTEAELGPEDWQYESLAQWDTLCNRGFQKWCVISAQNRAEWGMN